MALAERTARSVWKGDLMKGGGNVSFGTGAISDQPVSWPARTESPDGKTSPEELIAGAAAACWSMAFSHALHQQGHKSEQIDVTATVSLNKVEGGVGITHLHLAARGRVPGIDGAEFERLAKAQECPVTKSLKGNVEISIDATLDS